MRLNLMFLTVIMLAPFAAHAQLLPHHAIYDVKMLSHRQDGDFIDFSATLDFSLTQTCHSWITHYNTDAYYHYTDHIKPIRNTLTSVESLDGRSMDYAIRNYDDKILSEDIRGQIVNGTNTSQSRYTNNGIAEDVTFSSPMVFPFAHTQSLIQAARKGERFVNTIVFDGSSGNHAHHVHAVIGKKTGTVDGWPVSLAFFAYPADTTSVNIVPDYELHFMLFPDGIIRNMTAVYPDFTLRQSVTDLKLLEKPTCD